MIYTAQDTGAAENSETEITTKIDPSVPVGGHMNIILEGGDLLGKSTVLQELLLNVPRAETHHGTPIFTDDATIRKQLRDNLYQYWNINGYLNRATIYDRLWFISDLVYNPAASYQQYSTVVDFLKSLAIGTRIATVVILYTSHMAELEIRYKQRGDEYLDLNQIVDANTAYYRLVRHFVQEEIPFIPINVDNLSATEVAYTISTLISYTNEKLIARNKEEFANG